VVRPEALKRSPEQLAEYLAILERYRDSISLDSKGRVAGSSQNPERQSVAGLFRHCGIGNEDLDRSLSGTGLPDRSRSCAWQKSNVFLPILCT